MCSLYVASVFAMRVVSVVSLVSVVAPGERGHPKGRCLEVVFHPRIGLLMMPQETKQFFHLLVKGGHAHCSLSCVASARAASLAASRRWCWYSSSTLNASISVS